MRRSIRSSPPRASSQVELTGGGPAGLVLDEARDRAFVLTRFDNGLSVIDTSTLEETAHLQMFNPEPDHMVAGRPFLYDAAMTSSRGNLSCSGCHVFGDMDHLAWGLGNPDAAVADNPNEYNENSDNIATCNGCHVLDGAAGLFGSDGTMAIEGPGVAEDMKIPHLRNIYQKVGMFAENTVDASEPDLGP